MTTLLGLKDRLISDKEKTNCFINKIGGQPDWVKDGGRIPHCPNCRSALLLVVQLYCPLEDSPYHRTLYIFTCINKGCWNHPNSWIVLRSQVLDKSRVIDVSKKKKDSGTDDWGTGADDWGTNTDDWGTDADEWGTNTDDWGTGSGCAGTGSNGSEKYTSDFGMDICGESSENVVALKETKRSDVDTDTLIISNSNGVDDAKSSESSEGPNNRIGDDMDDVNISGLNVHDIDDDISDIDVNVVKSSDDNLPTEDGVNHMLTLLSCKQENTSPSQEVVSPSSVYSSLVSYYISVIEESAYYDSEDTEHIQKLLHQYREAGGSDIQNIDTSSGKSAEQYEKDKAVHGDTTFHKFMKKVSVCPQQCIRYHWNGTPLNISTQHKDLIIPVSRCEHCTGETVYELQLMSALVNLLKTADTSEPATEFGTVIIFTCKSSCWTDTDDVRREKVIVQPDPDQHLFRK